MTAQRIGAMALWLLTGTPAAAQFKGIAAPVTFSQNYDPSLSPDGKRMVFLKMLEGKEQLFIANSDGSGEKRLLDDRADIEDPAWSPDGSRVAYVRIANGKKAIHVMNIDATGDRRVTPPNQSPIYLRMDARRQGAALLHRRRPRSAGARMRPRFIGWTWTAEKSGP